MLRLRVGPTFRVPRLKFKPTTPNWSLSAASQARRRHTSSATKTRTKMASVSAAEATARHEASIKRNPHGDFKAVEASRPAFDSSASFRYMQTPAPGWTYGSGANSLHGEDAGEEQHQHISIDPHEEGRPPGFNYKLLISAIIPRPIALVSTLSSSSDGGGTSTNLAPFSYFSVINHDPPLFTIGFASASTGAAAKDTVRNLRETGECVINIISEGFVEAANSCSVNAPADLSEWDVSGLTPVGDSVAVGAPRVKEAVFSIEGRLESLREFESRAVPGKKSGTLAVIEGVRFWVRGDAINEERNLVDPAILRPISRLGGITYGRTTEALELPRPDFEKDVGGREGYDRIKKSHSVPEVAGGELPN